MEIAEGTSLESIRLHGADLLHEFTTNFKHKQNIKLALVVSNDEDPGDIKNLCISNMSHEQIIKTVMLLKQKELET